MSRNRSRRVRQSLKDKATHWQQAYRMVEGLSRYQGERLNELEHVLKDVERVVGDMSSLLPVTSIYHGRKFDINPRSPVYRIAPMVTLSPSMILSDDMPGDMVLTHHDLPLMLMELGEDRFRDHVHVQLRFDDKTSAYGISRKALATMSRERLEQTVRQVFMPELARHLVKQVKP